MTVADDAALGVEEPDKQVVPKRQGIEELRVTGRKRDEMLQDIPVSVRAFGAAEIEQRNMQRIDVLRGPQGTLFGKNTVGGLVNIITAKPAQEFGGSMRLNVGSFDTLETRLAVDVPITAGWFDEKLFTRYTLGTATDDGYLTNIYNGDEAGDNKLLSARFAATLLATEGLTLNTTFDWLRQNENAMVGRCRISGQESATLGDDGTRMSYGPYVVARYVADNFVTRDDFGSPPGFVAGQPYNFPEACAGVETLDRFEGYSNPLARLRTDTYGTSLDADWALPERWMPSYMQVSVRNVAGFRLRKEDNDPSDFDQTPVQYVELGSIEGRHYAVSDDLNANFDFDTEIPDFGVRVIAGAFGFYENGHDGGFGNINRDMALGQNAAFASETYDRTAGAARSAPCSRRSSARGAPTGPYRGQHSNDTEYLQKAVRWATGELNSETERDWNTLSLAGYGHVELDLWEDLSVTGGFGTRGNASSARARASASSAAASSARRATPSPEASSSKQRRSPTGTGCRCPTRS